MLSVWIFKVGSGRKGIIYDCLRVEIQSRAEVMAYQAGSRYHGYRIGCLQRKRLECVSVFAVDRRDGRDPTISLNRNSGKR